MGTMSLVMNEFGTRLRHEGHRLVVCKDDKAVLEVPEGDVGSVYVLTKGASVSAEAVRAVSENAGRILFCDGSGTPYAMVIGPGGLPSAQVRLKQAVAAGAPDGLRIAAALVAEKAQGQENTLRYYARTVQGLAPAIEAIRSQRARMEAMALPSVDPAAELPDADALRAAEAVAAQAYWSAFGSLVPPALAFPGRRKRGAEDPVNAALNYGYGILYARLHGPVLDVGLDPWCGLLHVSHPGRPSFICDFIEPFRSWFVERPLLGWLRRGGVPRRTAGGLDAPTRREVAGMVLNRFEARVTLRGREVKASAVVEEEARGVVAALAGEAPYRPFTWPW